MTIKNADMPAMPNTVHEDYQCGEGLPSGCTVTKQRIVNHGGLTKREHFAAMAMQGFISSLTDDDWRSASSLGKSAHDWVARHSVGFADALLKQLEKGE